MGWFKKEKQKTFVGHESVRIENSKINLINCLYWESF